MKRPRKQKGWAIQEGRGIIYLWTTRCTKGETIRKIVKSWDMSWPALRKKGFQAVKVTVMEGWEK
jgi:hypothetical protein